MSDENDNSHGATVRRVGQFSFITWLKNQMALLPLLAIFSAVAVTVADSHYDDKYVKIQTGNEVQHAVTEVQKAVAEIKTNQAVNSVEIKNINGSLQDVKASQQSIGEKLDRLIERRP